MKKILCFRNEYFFLSNFYPCKIEHEGLIYPGVENAFQAMKVPPSQREIFTKISTKEAKNLGRKVPLPHNWNSIKVSIMRNLIFKKFTQNPDLKEKLLATENAILIEGNFWGDTFWGVDLRKKDNRSPWGYKGKNILGQILMEVREILRKS